MDAIKRARLIQGALLVCQLVLLFFSRGTPPQGHYSSHEHRDRKVIKIGENVEGTISNQSLDLKALELTKDPEAAVHYLKAIEIDSSRCRNWSITSVFSSTFKNTSVDRLAELKKHETLFIKKRENRSFALFLGKYVHTVLFFFRKIVQFLATPFRFFIPKKTGL